MSPSEKVKALTRIGWKPTPQRWKPLITKGLNTNSPIKFRHRLIFFNLKLEEAYELSKPFFKLYEIVSTFTIQVSYHMRGKV